VRPVLRQQTSGPEERRASTVAQQVARILLCMRTLRSSVVALVFVAGCGGGVAEGLTAEELDSVRESGASTTSAHQAVVIADSLFDFDPTINPTLSAEANAMAVRDRIQSQLGACGTVALNNTTVTVSFGAAPGCTLVNGVTASGSLSASVAKVATTITVALTFTNLVINGKPLDGTAVFATNNGTTFNTMVRLASGSDALEASVIVTGASGSFTMSGTASGTRGSNSTAARFTTVRYRAGDCYPNGGSMAITRGPVSLTVTFTAATANSGQVTITQGRRTSTATLPAYGSCPRS
jgi:hypothetical protein